MLHLILSLGASSLAALASPAKFDPPDLELEARLHRAHVAARAPVEAPTTLAPDAYVESYRIDKGDTLWGLSKLLYGDGNYWPRVWSQNHQIANPHLVREGNSLQFLLGSEDDTPAFRFTEAGGESGVDLAAAGGAAIQIPPPEITPRPVLKLPSSFPEWQNVYRRAEKAMMDDRGLSRNRLPPIYRIFLRGWVQETKPELVGNLLENDTEAGLPMVNQYVFVKVSKEHALPKQKMLVIGLTDRIRRVNEVFENERDAYLVQISAELELSERIENNFSRSSDREKFETWRALITKTTGLSIESADLIVGDLKFVDISPSGPAGQGTAQIIGSERNPSSSLYGAGDLVFIDRGTAQGINTGEVFDIFADRRSRHVKTPVLYSPAAAGKLKIVRADDNVATAIVLEAHDSIRQGDRIREIAGRQAAQEVLDDVNLETHQVKAKEIRADGLDDDADLEKEINETF